MIRFTVEVVVVILIVAVMMMKLDGMSITEYGATYGYKKAIDRIWEGPPVKVPAPIAKELDDAINEVQK